MKLLGGIIFAPSGVTLAKMYGGVNYAKKVV
jgi:hypothetical protein